MFSFADRLLQQSMLGELADAELPFKIRSKQKIE